MSITPVFNSETLQAILPDQHINLPVPKDASGLGHQNDKLKALLREESCKANKNLKKAMPYLRRASRKIDAQAYKEAVLLGLKALDVDENIGLANHITALALDKLGCTSYALELYERALSLSPNEPEIYLNLGLLAWQMEKLDTAEKFFRIFCRMAPDSLDGPNNLACVLRDKGQFDDAIEVLRSAIYTYEGSALLWNSLGTVMMEQTEFGTAILFYEEALKYEPDLARAYHNIGLCKITSGETDEALTHFNKALDIGNLVRHEAAECLHARSMALLADGQIAQGWHEYDIRVKAEYNKATRFKSKGTLWDGENLNGKSITLLGEQGLGDEIMFMNPVPDILDRLGSDGRLVMGVEPRLVSLVQRTFPEADIHPHATLNIDHNHYRGIKNAPDTDYWAPLGSILKTLRVDVHSFPEQGTYLKPDPARIVYWRTQLDNLGDGPKIGFLWKSMLMSARRSKFYSPIENWTTILALKGINWVNLQYQSEASEIAQIESDYGVKIHNFDMLDLTNDLDDLAALTLALDMVVGPMNATINIAGACGANTAVIAAPNAWPYLGTNHLPWYPSARVFSPETIADWMPAMEQFATYLKAFTEDFARSPIDIA